MPNGVIRVYPASGATAMLPLTPANNYTPTILFCGGSAIADADWGDYTGPAVDAWTVTASKDCQRLTPEPSDGSQVHYEQDDDMLEPRTMGQFIILPTGKFLLLNGGQKGTAGYALSTKNTAEPNMPFGRSLATDPVLTPVIYDPSAPKGSRWSNQGLSPSNIPRLYHSTAMLLPDGSVIVAGSNPNPDVNLTTVYNTEYRADIFYPSYFSASLRPSPQNIPQTLSYGGSYFNVTIPSTSYSGSANDIADATTVTIVRGGFTTHAMNMGQRYMQLNNTYTVKKDGSITLQVSQLPPNPNLFQPGPALFFVNINGIPSTGKLVIIGNGNIGTQPTSSASQLPASVRLDGNVTGSGSTTPSSTSTASKSNKVLIFGIAAALALLALIGAIVGFCFARRKRAAALSEKSSYPMDGFKSGSLGSTGMRHFGRNSSATDSTDFAPLTNRGVLGRGYNEAWDSSTANLHAPYTPYRDDGSSVLSPQTPRYSDYDPYAAYTGVPRQPSDSMLHLNVNVHPGFGGGEGGMESPYSGSQTPVYDDPPPQQQPYQQYSSQVPPR